jgi:S1-C subfamily serine protease
LTIHIRTTIFKHVLKSFFVSWILLCGALTAFAASPEKSVIQITTFSQQPVWDAPWRFDAVRKSSGSGFVIRGKRIMTNAHVVSWARQILVHRFQDPRPFVARVAFIAHDCDLAILEVEDSRFFTGLEPLDIGDLPLVRSTVTTYGYPAGGEQISYTKGVVSRIEVQSYVHIGNRSYLAVQTDAAINPGNSGGPVIQDDKVVGVAFQGVSGLENTGYFIPPSLINHFLKDISDGSYHGFPQAGIRLIALQNPAYRSALKIPDNDLGARIDHVFDFPETKAVLKPDDVLLRVGSYDVASDGTIMYNGNRVFAAVAFSDAQHGETVPLKLWRDGKEIEISLPVTIYNTDRPEGNQYDVLPRYFVYGGVVFTPLSRDYMKTLGAGWADSANSDLLYELFYRRHEDPKSVRKEPIVIASVLSHAANANLEIRGRVLVDKINGVRIEQLEDVIRAFETPRTEGQDVIELFPEHSMECLDRVEAKKSGTEIMKIYGIAKDRRL